MSYTGTTTPFNLGQLGLHTDDPQAVIPPNAAIKANNVSMYKGVLTKAAGSAAYSTTALPANVVAVFDWWPTPTQQRMIAATADGKIWRDSGDGTWGTLTNMPLVESQQVTFSAVPDAGSFKITWGGNDSTAISYTATAATVQTAVRTIAGLATATVEGSFTAGFTVFFYGQSGPVASFTATSNSLTKSAGAVTATIAKIMAGNTGSMGTFTTDVHFVAGGVESLGKSRRLFIFTGGVTQVLMITGDSSSITAITTPAADWSSGPTYGAIMQGRLVAWGTGNSRHRIYISTLGDQTNFSTAATDGSGAATFPVFSGEGDGLVSGIVYKKSSLVLLKKPLGAYVFNWNGGDVSDPSNFSIDRFSDSFGVASPHSACIVEDDLWGGTSTGSIFSLTATQAYGSFQKGDILNVTNTRNYIRDITDASGFAKQHAVYYSEKQVAMFTAKGVGSLVQNLIIMVDMAKQAPRVSIETKDNPTCLGLRRDTNSIDRPMYGSTDGRIYIMDNANHAAAGLAYTGEFQTPYTDFSYMDASLSDKNKIFDFLALTFKVTGSYNFYVDVFIDGEYSETIPYIMQVSGAVLDSFVLDVDTLSDNYGIKQIRKPMHCSGRTLSLRIYNSGLNQSFQVERAVIGFRVGAEQNRSSRS